MTWPCECARVPLEDYRPSAEEVIAGAIEESADAGHTPEVAAMNILGSLAASGYLITTSFIGVGASA